MDVTQCNLETSWSVTILQHKVAQIRVHNNLPTRH